MNGSNADLLANIARLRPETASEVVTDSRIAYLDEPGLESLGLTKKQAKAIASAFELARRFGAVEDRDSDPIRNSNRLGRKLVARYSHEPQEHMIGIYLDSRHRVITERVVFKGTVNAATVSTRDLIRIAFEVNATSLIIAHNHPSGDPSPSAEDLLFTKRLQDACKLMNVEFVDHLIIGMNRYVSLKDRGAM